MTGTAVFHTAVLFCIIFSPPHTLVPATSQYSFTQEDLVMNHTPNQSIKCTVNNCTHHCQDENYCSLDSIQVGTHETNPTEIKCTDCESFKLK